MILRDRDDAETWPSYAEGVRQFQPRVDASATLGSKRLILCGTLKEFATGEAFANTFSV